MDSIFPFGFETELTLYLVVYLLTLIVHVFLMAYVLAGSLWLSCVTLFPGRATIARANQPLARILRDWLPFALSGAITAGVAPLLFVQILYRQQFYTANLLLGWRWMVVIPTLVVAFYLLYLIKSRAVTRLALPLRIGLSFSVAACFLFVAFCWTANHLLGLNASQWPAIYGSGDVMPSGVALLLRLSTWVGGTFPTMSILAIWQLRAMRPRAAGWDESVAVGDWEPYFDAESRRLAVLSIIGLVVSGLCAIGYVSTLSPAIRASLLGNQGLPWLIIAVAGGLLQLLCWIIHFRRRCFCSRWIGAVTVALFTTLIAVASLRELIRIDHVDPEQLARGAIDAAQIGWFGLFLVFTILNLGLIAWCLQIVRSQMKK